jgi:membrane-associated HD superfamily phosphohydrolase
MNHLKILSIAISIAILLWWASISYYFLVTLPEQNDRKIAIQEEELQMKKDTIEKAEIEKKEKEQAEKDEAIRKNYAEETCINSARESYTSSWNTFCKIWKKEVDDSWNNCIKTVFSWETPDDAKTRYKTSTPDYSLDENKICLLPDKYSKNIENAFDKAKNECKK